MLFVLEILVWGIVFIRFRAYQSLRADRNYAPHFFIISCTVCENVDLIIIFAHSLDKTNIPWNYFLLKAGFADAITGSYHWVSAWHQA